MLWRQLEINKKMSDSLTYLKLRKISFIIVVICIATIIISGFDTIMAKIRDVKRKADVNSVVKALDLYYDEYGFFPESIDDWRGWDLTYEYKEKGFLDILKEKRYIDRVVKDPINNATHHYRYQKYPAGSFGCEKSFYILQILSFELPTYKNGGGSCSELNWTELAPNGYTVQMFD